MNRKNLSPQACQILNRQENKESFINDAILYYSNSFLPTDQRIVLMQQEIARMNREKAATECYVTELEETNSVIKRAYENLQRSAAPPVDLDETRKLAKDQKLAILADQRVIELTKCIEAQRKTITRLREDIQFLATKVFKSSQIAQNAHFESSVSTSQTDQ